MDKHPIESIMSVGAPGITIATFLFIFAQIIYPNALEDSDIALIYPLIIISAIFFFVSSIFLMLHYWIKFSEYTPKTLSTTASMLTLTLAIFSLLLAGFFIIYEKILDDYMSFGEAIILTSVIYIVYYICKNFK